MQSKLESFLEACMNTGVGFFMSLALSAVVYPLFGHSFTFSQNVKITVIFTAASILRGYAVRRWFNARIHAAASRMAKAVA